MMCCGWCDVGGDRVVCYGVGGMWCVGGIWSGFICGVM